MRPAYTQGVEAALSTYGLKSAGLLRRGMPQGPSHIGAERLSKLLSDIPDQGRGASPSLNPRFKKMRWGPSVSIDTLGRYNNPGVGEFGGV